jgi:glycosyltransferase involved in cell wall biosynthesis
MRRVSVLLPTYRYAAYLDEAVESVLRQDFQDFELIISDDASGDGTAEKIAAYVARDARVRGFVQPRNLGMVANWNWCLAQATGEAVKFLFGDDYFPNRRALGLLLEALDENPGTTLVTGQRIWVNAAGEPTLTPPSLPAAGRLTGAEAIAMCVRADRNLIGEPSAVLFRRSAALRGFDPSFRQLVDLEMWYHLLISGDLVTLPSTVLAFRVHPQQQTALNSESRIASVETLRLAARYPAYFRAAFGGRFLLGPYQRRMSRGTFLACLCVHRLIKPLENLRRKIAARPQSPS